MPRKRAKKERQFCPSSCVACGTAATGYHYDAPSCIPCKTFFRRTVLEERMHSTCFKDGMCDKNESIDPCRTCRFIRCVEGGMNPLLILNLHHPQSNAVVQRIFQMRTFIDSEASTSSSSTDSSPRELRILHRASPSVIEYQMDRLIGGLLHLEKAHRYLRESAFSPSLKDGYRLETLIVSRSILSITFENGQNSPADITTREDIPMASTPGTTKFWPFVDLFLSIEYMKTFEFFHHLSLEDKKALVRHVSVMCAHLTLAYFSYENKSDITYHPDGTIPHSGRVAGGLKHETQLHHGIIQILRLLDLDKKEYVLLKALIVCNPAIEDLSFSYKVDLENERMKYSKSLMSYVMYRRGHEKGPAAFTAIMAVVDTLSHLMMNHKNWFVLRQATNYKLGSREKPNLLTDIYCH